MNPDLLKVLLLLAATIAMFVAGRPRMDVVGLIVIAALPLLGVIEAGEALTGFADQNVVLIGLLFVVGEGLVRTGIAQGIGDRLVARAGASEGRLIALLMIAVAGMGSVMSSTGVVAIFIPVALRIAARTGLPASRLLMPLSVAALLSGMMTLVGTPPNLVVQRELLHGGHAGFGFFSFTPFGLPLLALAIGWMLLARRWLGASAPPEPHPGRPRLAQWVGEYTLHERLFRLRIRRGSPLVGRPLQQLDLRAEAGLNLLVIDRGRDHQHHFTPAAATNLVAGDILLADEPTPGRPLAEVAERLGLEPLPLQEADLAHENQPLGMAEFVVPAHSPLAGQTLAQSRFRSQHDLTVIGLKHGATPRSPDLLAQPLHAGDTLLVAGPWRAIRRLQGNQNELVLLNLPRESEAVAPAAARAPFALAALVLMIVLMTTGAVPNVVAALLACLLLGATGCVSLTAAYRSIHWPTLILIVGMIPFSLALEKTGGVQLAAQALQDVAGAAGPRALLAALFVFTALLGLFISNTATAILVAPVAMSLAAQQGLAPHPFAMTVALAASAAFMTPVSSPVNTLVVGPGGYRFMDFVRVGVPLAVAALIVTVLLVPLLLPF